MMHTFKFHEFIAAILTWCLAASAWPTFAAPELLKGPMFVGDGTVVVDQDRTVLESGLVRMVMLREPWASALDECLLQIPTRRQMTSPIEDLGVWVQMIQIFPRDWKVFSGCLKKSPVLQLSVAGLVAGLKDGQDFTGLTLDRSKRQRTKVSRVTSQQSILPSGIHKYWKKNKSTVVQVRINLDPEVGVIAPGLEVALSLVVSQVFGSSEGLNPIVLGMSRGAKWQLRAQWPVVGKWSPSDEKKLAALPDLLRDECKRDGWKEKASQLRPFQANDLDRRLLSWALWGLNLEGSELRKLPWGAVPDKAFDCDRLSRIRASSDLELWLQSPTAK